MTPAELKKLLQKIPNMSDAEARDLYASVEEHEILKEREEARGNFMVFVKKVWPHFIEGAHHKRMAAAFERVARGDRGFSVSRGRASRRLEARRLVRAVRRRRLLLQIGRAHV